jgi:cytochrome c
MTLGLAGCGNDSTSANSNDIESVQYLNPELNKMATRAEKKDPSNPYSAEVAGNNTLVEDGKSRKCSTPKAFVDVWAKYDQELATPATIFGYGKPISEKVMTGDWNLSVLGDGTGLPAEGVGMTILDGGDMYLKYCAACHGEFGEGNGHYLPLAGGPDDVTDNGGPMPVKTLKNYWPSGITFFDYARRAMPFFYPNHPDIGDAGYMGIAGYIMMMNGYKDAEGNELNEDTFFDSKQLRAVDAQVKAKNGVRFFCDDRPSEHNTRCGLPGGKACSDEWIGDGKGDIHKYREALTNPLTNLPQYNNNQRH